MKYIRMGVDKPVSKLKIRATLTTNINHSFPIHLVYIHLFSPALQYLISFLLHTYLTHLLSSSSLNRF